MKVIQVSFDFDSTLSKQHVQDYAFSLINKGIEIWILTSRFQNPLDYTWNKNINIHDDLFKVTEKLNIPKERIIFTNMIGKWEYLEQPHKFEIKNFNPIFHLDDDYIELNQINKYTKVKAISVINSNYKKKCNKIIENEQIL